MDSTESAATRTPTRPRITGAREDAIFDATLSLLRDVGYDRLTMDAVASAAKAGKASLYRRWSTKGDLVVDALTRCERIEPTDTGSLRGDLLALACDRTGQFDLDSVDLIASLMTAMHRHTDLREAFYERFLEPRMRVTRAVLARAKARGDVDERVDIDLLIDIIPGMVMHRLLLRGEQPSAELVVAVIDQVLLPACRRLSVPPA